MNNGRSEFCPRTDKAGDNKNHFTLTLPNGSWKTLISTDKMVNDMIYEGELILEPTSGILLRKI